VQVTFALAVFLRTDEQTSGRSSLFRVAWRHA
jgi:hypothetical protein